MKLNLVKIVKKIQREKLVKQYMRWMRKMYYKHGG